MTAPARNLPIRIVGVVADAIYVSLRESPHPTIYLPIDQHDELFFARALEHVGVNVRSDGGSPGRLAKSVTAAIASVDPRLKVTIRPLADQSGDSLARGRVIAMLAGFFGLLAIAGGPWALRRDVMRQCRDLGNRSAAPARAQRSRLVLSESPCWWPRCDPRRRRSLAARLVASLVGLGRAIRDAHQRRVTLAAVGAFAGWLPARRLADRSLWRCAPNESRHGAVPPPPGTLRQRQADDGLAEEMEIRRAMARELELLGVETTEARFAAARAFAQHRARPRRGAARVDRTVARQPAAGRVVRRAQSAAPTGICGGGHRGARDRRGTAHGAGHRARRRRTPAMAGRHEPGSPGPALSVRTEHAAGRILDGGRSGPRRPHALARRRRRDDGRGGPGRIR